MDPEDPVSATASVETLKSPPSNTTGQAGLANLSVEQVAAPQQ